MVKGVGPLGWVTGGLQAIGSVVSGEAAGAAGRANQKLAQRNALGIERDAAAEGARTRDDVRRQLGQQLTAQGESGFEMGTGSALDALMASQVEGMLDQMTIRRRAASAADAERFKGDIARRSGDASRTAGMFGAAEALARTASNYANYGSGGR